MTERLLSENEKLKAIPRYHKGACPQAWPSPRLKKLPCICGLDEAVQAIEVRSQPDRETTEVPADLLIHDPEER